MTETVLEKLWKDTAKQVELIYTMLVHLAPKLLDADELDTLSKELIMLREKR